MSRRFDKRLLSVLLAAVVALALMPAVAFAEDADNVINTQQIPDSSFLYDTSIADLSNADSSFDGQTVQITGEVVGDNIADEQDESMRWITLSSMEDGKSGSISVLMSVDDAKLIDTYGQYGTTGTTVRVKGIFHLACSEHEGLSDVHADTVTIVQKGSIHRDTFDFAQFVPGLVTVGVGLVLLVVFRILRERRR